jgi:hypothetical protein
MSSALPLNVETAPLGAAPKSSNANPQPAPCCANSNAGKALCLEA